MRIVKLPLHTIRHRILLIGLLSIGWQALLGAVPQFQNDSIVQSNSGYIKLTWSLPESQSPNITNTYILQEASDSLFSTPKTIYSGPDRASFLSGLRNGTYFYRVANKPIHTNKIEWSSPLKLVVKHHSLKLAYILLIAGCIIFLATVVVVIQGNIKYKV